MKCSVYIATSVDGFIAGNDGNVYWLETAGKPDAGMGGDPYVDMIRRASEDQARKSID